ncbi:Gfo/Idh/MocA family oxidoreductase [Nitrospirillum pindoramense]|uniref:Virulence factor n=1 Tax=Nitrospirillum amazonense TaxID=28077 RepID=A0A560HLR5_9PROT|nr:Gfo/Idh/MocA family oxidoreductase [Nitrospirillum amazonense]TWB46080.1 virulence factor [Nitrospirillum amazonense]
MRVAMIGLGDIARKAYLPVLGTRGDLTLSLMSRDSDKVRAIAADWRVAHAHTNLDDLLRDGLDAAFVHAATAAHEELVTRLLTAGIPTYVDKPLADTADAAERLVNLAEARAVSLMVGFNRRHAPAYAALAAAPRDLVLMQKHRVDLADTPRTVVFDDFIHVVDTLRFLLPVPARDLRVDARVVDGLLHHVVLTLVGGGGASGDGASACTAIGTMNRVAGVNEEVLEVSGMDHHGQALRHRVVDMADIHIAEAGTHISTRRGDWTPVSDQRGIHQAVEHFLAALRAGRTLSARDALETHRLCETVVRHIQAAA